MYRKYSTECFLPVHKISSSARLAKVSTTMKLRERTSYEYLVGEDQRIYDPTDIYMIQRVEDGDPTDI
jgi:hypothetical protein